MANAFTDLFKRKGVIIIPQQGPGVPANPTATNGVAIDATLSQVHSRSSSVTEFSVGMGQTATDHVVRNPESLSLTGVFTDTPVRFIAGVIDVFGEQLAQPEDIFTEDLRARSLRRFDNVEEFWRRRQFVTVFTTIRAYRDCQIESLEAVKDQDTGDTVGVSLTFRIVRLLSTAFAESVLDTDADIAGGNDTADLGTQGASPA